MQAEELLHGIWIVFFIPRHLPAVAEILATFIYPSDASRSSGVKVREEGPCSVEVGVDVDEDDFADYGF